MVRANGSISAPRRPSTSSGRVSGIFGIFLGDSLSLSEFGAFTFEDELFSQLQFFRHGARHQDLGTSPNLGRTAPMCTPQQQRSAAGAQQQRCGLSGWAVTHMGQSHVGHTAHTHTHTHTHTAHPTSLVYITQCTYPITYATHSHTHGILGWLGGGGTRRSFKRIPLQ